MKPVLPERSESWIKSNLIYTSVRSPAAMAQDRDSKKEIPAMKILALDIGKIQDGGV